MDDRLELRSKGCSGSIRLEAVDAERKPLGVQATFVELGDAEEKQHAQLSNDNP